MTDAVSIRQDILSKKTTATQVAERFLSRLAAIDPKVRAFLSVNREAALAQLLDARRRVRGYRGAREQAGRSDERFAQGHDHALHGIA